MKMILAIVWLVATLMTSGHVVDENGIYGTIPAETFSTAQRLFPACPTEDSDMCIWDANRPGTGPGAGHGESFISIFGYVIIFD